MIKTMGFWKLFESHSKETSVMEAWRMAAGDDFSCLRAFLKPTDKPAFRYPTPKPYGPSLAIIHHKDGSIVAVDQEEYDVRIPLEPEDIVTYKFSVENARRMLCEALGLQSAGSYDIQRLGRIEIAPGDQRSVFLLLYGGHGRLENTVKQLLLDEAEPFIILTPTNRYWEESLLETAKRRGTIFVALQDVMEISDEGFTANPAWDKTIKAFHKSLYPDSMVPKSPDFMFQRKGEAWLISYEGQSTILKDIVGNRYLVELLSRPYDPIFGIDLKAIIDGEVPESTPKSDNAIEMADKEAIRDVEQRYIELSETIEEAERDGNVMVYDEAQREMDELVDYLRKTRGLCGRPRMARDDAERVRDVIRKAISRTIERLEEELPNAARHLKNSVQAGYVLNYLPEKEIAWSV